MDKREKRLEPRISTKAILVSVNGGQSQVYGFVKDISGSGVGLRTFTTSLPYPIDVGEKVRLEFRLPDCELCIDCEAEAVWNCETNGGPCEIMRQGFRFTVIEPCIKEEIADWIKDRL